MNIFKNTIKKETTDTRAFSYSKNKVQLNFSLRTDIKSEMKDFRELLLQAVEDINKELN
jgi:hypothetical protein